MKTSCPSNMCRLYIAGMAFVLLLLLKISAQASILASVSTRNDLSVVQKDFLTQIYKTNKDQYWWNSSMTVPQMQMLLSSADSHGLKLQKYKDLLQPLVDKTNNGIPFEIDEAEIRYTLSYFTYLLDLYRGAVTPELFFNEGVKLATKSLAQFLNQINLAKTQSQQSGLSIYDWPNLFSPKATEYQTLKALLARLKNIDAQGGFVSVVLSANGKSIRPGQIGPEIIPLRKRLYQQGYAISNLNSTDYDAEVLRAVTLFQKEAGLTADGVIGPKTQTAFNFSVKQRLRQVELNLERFRWYPQDFGNRFIYVNIASQKFYLQENGNKVLTMKVIVGKPDRKTPMLVDRSSSVVFNPAWVVPPTVFREDVFPFLKVSDLSILNKKRLTIFNDDDQPVDPNSVNWSKYSADNVPYYFKQVAGYSGALGVLKFNLSNPYAIYLHDTGLRNLFNEEVRYLSSGCVRLEKPVQLANYLLKDKMVEADIRSALLENDNVPPEKESEKRVSYNQSIPVYINYMTADLDVDGHMVFYNDTYQADANLHKRY